MAGASGVSRVGVVGSGIMGAGCNFPMGPFELLDLIGLDTTLRILETLHRENGDAASLPHPELRRLVAAGHLGRKTGRGFLEYEA